MNKNDNYIISNPIIRFILKLLMILFFLLLIQLAFGSIILGKIYNINSEMYLLDNSSNISSIERKFISKKISSCQKFNENRYIINPLNFFIDDKSLQIIIKSGLEKCLINYVLNSDDNQEMKYRKDQANFILNKKIIY